MIRGSCLCGDIAYAADGALAVMTHCHCSMCRKAHGSAFSTGAAALAAEFRWARGAARVVIYRSSADGRRCFCPRCGSVAPNPSADGRFVFLPIGCLDDDPGARPLAHLFVGSKAPWHEISDDLPRYDAYPPGFGVPENSAPADGEASPPQPGALRGSCLCRRVAFAVRGPFDGFRNCHCSRCRKMVSAAYASDFTVAAAELHWLRGADRVRSFHLSGSTAFDTSFCADCGSPLPHPLRLDPSRALVQAGALDDDPGIGPTCHIFVGSKAPWLDIADALPRYDIYPP
jgi:hypothetical protein